LKSTETIAYSEHLPAVAEDFSNFGSLKSTETKSLNPTPRSARGFQQFRLVEEH